MTTIGNIDRTLAATAGLLTTALERINLDEATTVSECLDALLDHRLAQMALRP